MVILILLSYVLWDHVYLATIKMSAKYENAVAYPAYPSSHHRSLENGPNLCQGNYIVLETSHFSAEPFKKPQTRKKTPSFEALERCFRTLVPRICATHSSELPNVWGLTVHLFHPPSVTLRCHHPIFANRPFRGTTKPPTTSGSAPPPHHPRNFIESWNSSQNYLRQRKPTPEMKPGFFSQ